MNNESESSGSVDLQKIMDRIRKLQALATSTNVHEAANAAAKASALLDQYRLSQADINLSGTTVETQRKPDVTSVNEVYQAGRIIPWKVRLLGVLASHYSCRVIHWKGHRTNNYTLVGVVEDVDIVRFMFTWLLLDVQNICNLEMKGRGHVACFSYCEGAVSGIATQLSRQREIMRTEAVKSGQSMALMVLDQRQTYVDSEKNRIIAPYAGRSKALPASKSRFDAWAFQRGQVTGENLHLGKKLRA